MSSLYNTIRPQTFSALSGNDGIKKTLQEMFSSSKFPTSLLFFGPSGTGKTTSARIIARMLKCSPHDIAEYNAANTRGIDTIREIKELCDYTPMGGGWRLVILDEAHQLVSTAQEALLKLLEDVPEKTVFILCTTDPDKLIATVRNRCVDFRFVLLNDSEMGELLQDSCNKMNIKLTPEVLEVIVEFSGGCPRAALVALEKVSHCTTPKEIEDVLVGTFNTNTKGDIIELCRSLLKGVDSRTAIDILARIEKIEPESAKMTMVAYFLAVAKNNKTRGDLLCKVIRFIHVLNSYNFLESGKRGEAKLVELVYRCCSSD